MLQAVSGAAGCVLFIALTVYFATAANGAPRVKHIILFVALALISALVVWFSTPPAGRPDD
jgi:hypothetical protein